MWISIAFHDHLGKQINYCHNEENTQTCVNKIVNVELVEWLRWSNQIIELGEFVVHIINLFS